LQRVDPSGRFGISATFASLAISFAAELSKAANDVRRGEDIKDLHLGVLVSQLMIMNGYITETEEPKLKGKVAAVEKYNIGMAIRAVHNTAAYLKSTKDGGTNTRRYLTNVLMGYGLIQITGFAGVLMPKSNGLPNFTESLFAPLLYGFVPGSVVALRHLTGSRYQDKMAANNAANASSLSNPFSLGLAWHHHEVLGIMLLVPNLGWHKLLEHVGGVFFYQLSTGRKYKS
jgi:hypothetical protein